MSEHATEIREAKAPNMPTLYRAQCACGWRGRTIPDRGIAFNEANVHHPNPDEVMLVRIMHNVTCPGGECQHESEYWPDLHRQAGIILAKYVLTPRLPAKRTKS